MSEQIVALIKEQGEAITALRDGLESKTVNKEEVKRMQDALDAIEIKMKQVNTSPVTEQKQIEGMFAVSQEHRVAFEKFGRKGLEAVTPDELKFMSTQNDTTGGFLASYQYDNEIIKGLVESSPIRQLCRVTPTSKRGVHIPVRKTTPTAYWTGIGEEPSESNGTYGLEELENHSMTAKVIIHQDDLDDSDFNMESEITMDAIEQFAVLEGAGFITGDTKKKPEGLLFNKSITALETIGAGAISGDDLIALYYSLKSGHATVGDWIMQRDTIRLIRTLKDSEGRYIWTPTGGVEALPFNAILGRPYHEMPDMPKVATGASAVMFGNFKKGYRISDKKGIEVVRDGLTRAGKREVIFYLHKRVGGMVVLPEAIAKLNIK